MAEDITGDVKDFLDDISLKAAVDAGKDLPTVFTDTDVKEMTDWMAGVAKEPPDAVSKMLNNIAVRLSWSMAYLVATMLVRINRLSGFLMKCEQQLFSDEVMGSVDTETLLELYEKAIKTQQASLEFVRKFIIQNKDSLASLNPEMDEVVKLLGSLPPTKLQALRVKLTEGA